jgi:phosphoenolpyruvate-protein phosphotransferase (PTS system enzyme I)
MPRQRKARRLLLSGIGASPGLARGPACQLVSLEYNVPTSRIPPKQVASEIRKFRRALSDSRDEIRSLRDNLKMKSGDPGDLILVSHQMILSDRELMREIAMAIKSERMNAAHAVRRIFQAKARYLESLSSDLFRSRAADIIDVKGRVIRHILGKKAGLLHNLPKGSILVASELNPSDTAVLDPEKVVAFVTDHGTLASHVTIMARARGVPAVIGIPDVTKRIPEDAPLIVDGDRGIVIVSPNRNDIAEYNEAQKRVETIHQLLSGRESEVAVTLDGKEIPTRANVGGPEDAPAAKASGAEGVGLFRSEFFFLEKTSFPSENVQTESYTKVVRAFPGAPVTIRTLDLGGDKTASLMGEIHEDNPFLGLRGIRFCFEHKEIFNVQLRALLRASVHGNVRILLPMISNLDELREAKVLISGNIQALRSEGIDIPDKIEVGVMIEVPSAVMMADKLAKEADFFSIGSNDLIQYTLAVDRGNERIASLYDALNPAVLRAIDQTIAGAHKARISVGSCGEMSGDLMGLLMLIGIGVDEVSVVPSLVRRVKALISRIEFAELERMAARCLDAGCIIDVRRIVKETLDSKDQFQIEEQEGRLNCRWFPEKIQEK